MIGLYLTCRKSESAVAGSKDEDTMMLIVADLIPPRECPALDGRVFEVDLQSEAGDFD